MISPKRAFRHVLLAVVAALGILALAGAPAMALDTHVLSTSFGSPGAGAGELSSPAGVAVSTATHAVYVADAGNFRVDELSSTGTFLRAWGWGVADGLPAFETCTLACQQGLSGAGAGQFTTPSFVAVDNSAGPSAGDVYVGDSGDGLVSKFTAAGALVESWGVHGQLDGSTATDGPFATIDGIAVDAGGTLMVINELSRLFEFTQSGAFVEDLEVARGTSPGGLAVDSEGNLFKVNGGASPEEIGASGNDIGQVTEETPTPTGLAVDASSDLYVDTGSEVEHYAFAGPGQISESGGATCAIEPFTGCPADDGFGSGELSLGAGLAVDPANHDVYAADAEADAIRVFIPARLPSLSTGTATEPAAGAFTLNGSVDPSGLAVTSCEFEYGTSTAYGSTAECASNPGSGSGAVAVSARVSGLQAGAEYHYRLVAGNANGVNHGEDRTVYVGPTVEEQATAGVASAEATVSARISGEGFPTSYHVEYGASAAYGSSSAETSIGAPQQAVSVRATLTDLKPGTTYHFRFVARNASASAAGGDLTFSTPQSAAATAPTLPDARAYELVSPPDSTEAYMPNYHQEFESPTGEFIAVPKHFRASASGEQVAYMGDPPASGATGSGATGDGDGNQYRSTRTAAGWVASDVELPAGGEEGLPEFTPLAADFSVWTVGTEYPIAASPSKPAGCHSTLYSLTASGYHALIDNPQTPGACYASSAAISADDSHILLYSSQAYTPGAQQGASFTNDNLYDSVNGQLHQVNILPNGEPQQQPDASFGAVAEGESFDFGGVVSADGSRVFWTDLSTEVTAEDPSGQSRLFVRSNDAMPQSPLGPHGECAVAADACTVQVDAAQPGAEGPSGGGRYWDASDDGSKVLFTDESRLMVGSTAASGEPDLYEYDLETGSLVDLTRAGGGSHADVQGLAGASADASYVYFVADGALGSGANAEGHEPVAGQPNLYLSHAGSTSFIATLTASDDNLLPSCCNPNQGDWQPVPGLRTAQADSDGHVLVFQSRQRLTGYDNRGIVGYIYGSNGPETPILGEQPEVFVYQADSGRISCASCNPTGAPPVATAEVWEDERGGYLGTSSSSAFQLRWLNDAGTQAYFMSSQPLVPQDTNHFQDVYEWEADGSGDCRAAGGCISLLSTGTTPNPAYFIDASTSGDDVFLTSRALLAPQATDEALKVYDARVNGGFPEPSLACTGTGCQGVPPAPPIFATPSSATFNGVGNFPAPTPAKSVKPRRKTAAQVRKEKLTRALRACRKKPKKQRTVCEKSARKHYARVQKKGKR